MQKPHLAMNSTVQNTALHVVFALGTYVASLEGLQLVRSPFLGGFGGADEYPPLNGTLPCVMPDRAHLRAARCFRPGNVRSNLRRAATFEVALFWVILGMVVNAPP